MTPKVLYLSMVGKSPSHEGKLAGVRRYCASRGWEAVPVFREDVSIEALPSILQRHCPVGCVIDGVGRRFDLSPRLFGEVPVSYIGYSRGKTAHFPNFVFDPAAIAEMALRELSSGKPPCYAAIGHPNSWPWSLGRVRAFRAAVRASGAKCLVFPAKPRIARETWDAFVERLAAWLAALPEHCAVFVVSDETAVRVARAARAAMRHIPRSLTLLSVDNFTDLCESADPPISSIQLDFEREGFIAARALETAVVMQHVYNGRPAEADALAARLRGWGLAASVAELGLPTGPEEERACLGFIMGTKTMKAACEVDDQAEARLGEALKAIFR